MMSLGMPSRHEAFPLEIFLRHASYVLHVKSEVIVVFGDDTIYGYPCILVNGTHTSGSVVSWVSIKWGLSLK